MKLTVTKVGINNKSKDGVPFIDKNSKPFYKAYLKAEEFGDKYISNNYIVEPSQVSAIQQIQVGNVVDFDVEESLYQGKKYLNFKFAKKSISRAELQELKDYVDSLEKRIAHLEAQVLIQTPARGTLEEPPIFEEDGINCEDLPF